MAMSKMQFEREVDAKLRQFANGLKAEEDYLDEGIRLCQNVRKHLEQHCGSRGFSVHSSHYGGSIGKKTDVREPDFDIVMKINNRRPPFNDVLDYFEKELKTNAGSLQINPHSFKRTRYSIQFGFTDGKEVDLLAAVADMSPEEIYQEMRKDFRKRRYYNSSLVEKQVQFMKDQSGFAHAVTRLAKYWYKSMDVGGVYVSGGSTIFELLAVAAVLEEKKARPYENDSMLNVFNRLIQMVESFDHLAVAFEKGYNKWNVKGHQIYGQTRPYIFEPANPTNNLLQGMKRTVMEIIKKNGRVMRERIHGLKERQQFCQFDYRGNLNINFDGIFASVSI